MSTVINLTKGTLPLSGQQGPLAIGEQRANVSIGALEQTYLDAKPPKLGLLDGSTPVVPLPDRRVVTVDFAGVPDGQAVVRDSTSPTGSKFSPVGGSGVIKPFAAATAYKQGQPVTQAGRTYLAKADFTSGSSFSAGDWDLLPVTVNVSDLGFDPETQTEADVAHAAIDARVAAKSDPLIPIAPVTGAGTLAVNRHTPVDTATSGAVSMALPSSGVKAGDRVGVENSNAALAPPVVTVTGSIRGTANASRTLELSYETLTFTADANGSWWPTAGHKTKAALDSRYDPIRAAVPKDLARSAALHASDVAATPGTLEKFADLSQWSKWGDPQVSGGKFYGGTTPGASGYWGISKPLTIPATGRFSIVVPYRTPATQSASGNILIVGLTGDAGGFVPPDSTSVAAKGVLIGLGAVTGNVFINDHGTVVAANATTGVPANVFLGEGNNFASSGAAPASSDLNIVIEGDENWVTFSVLTRDGASMATFVVARSKFPATTDAPSGIGNLYIATNDVRGTSGVGVGPVEIVNGRFGRVADAASPAGARFLITRPDTSQPLGGLVGQSSRIWLPSGYDDAVGAPVLFWCHGYGGNEAELWSFAPCKPILLAALAAGYIVATTAMGGNTFGNGVAQQDLRVLARYVRDRFKVTGGIVAGTSMGGLTAAVAGKRRTIPWVKGAACFQPLLNLDAFLQALTGTATQSNGHTFDTDYGAAFRLAYGLTANTDAMARHKWAGYNPMSGPDPEYLLPFYISASPGDTTAIKANNTDPFAAMVSEYAPVTLRTASGDHNDPSMFSDTAGFLAWAQAALAAA